MQFKNPEIFYFLALLIIPILVHLFQLQKFVKVSFTNVAYLQKLVQETRKSSRLKKWLILANRLLLFLAILFAFSQPYYSSKKISKIIHNLIYLDNSLSLNANGKKGNLLKVAAQEIIENTKENNVYSLQTNNNFYSNISKKELKNILLKLDFSSNKVDIPAVLLKFKQENKKKTNTLNKLFLISDFQNTYVKEFTNVTPDFSVIKLQQSLNNNISLDSMFVNNTTNENFLLNVVVKNQSNAKNEIPISIFNQDKLVSKQSFSIAENTKKTIQFNIQKQKDFSGKITVTFSDTFSFDNTFYFNLKNSKKVNILAIGNNLDFLSKIYSKSEFNLTKTSVSNVNYSSIKKQDLIVISELDNLPQILENRILEFSKNGGDLVIIPNEKSDIKSYNNLLQKLNVGLLKPVLKDSLKITTINYNHPLFKNVFSKRVRNFQYPEIYSYFPSVRKNSTTILSFENNIPFITEAVNTNNSNIYILSAAINKENSNFLNSPIIVPIFYNFGKLSFKHSKLHYELQKNNKIDVETSLNKDEIIKITGQNTSFIPLQQTFQNKVTITTDNQPEKAGIYSLLAKNDTISKIAFNNPRNESNLDFLDLKKLKKINKNITISNSIADVFSTHNKKNEVQWLWKWFLALAIVSLFLEILILKFYKP